jgi:hypothetical protein
MSVDHRLGLGGVLLAAFSLAAFYLWPDRKWIGWCALAVTAAVAVSWSTVEIKQIFGPTKWPFVFALIVGALLGSGAVAIIWYTPAASAPGATTDQKIQLSLTCDTVTLPIPFRGDVWVLDTVFFVGLAKFSPPPLNTGDSVWPEKDTSGIGYRCSIKNHGVHSAFGVTIPIHLDVREIIHDLADKTRTGWHSGAVTATHDMVLSVPMPLSQSGQDEFVFYVCSFDPSHYIEVNFPDSAAANGDDGTAKTTTGLRVSSTMGNPIGVAPRQNVKAAVHAQHQKTTTAARGVTTETRRTLSDSDYINPPRDGTAGPTGWRRLRLDQAEALGIWLNQIQDLTAVRVLASARDPEAWEFASEFVRVIKMTPRLTLVGGGMTDSQTDGLFGVTIMLGQGQEWENVFSAQVEAAFARSFITVIGRGIDNSLAGAQIDIIVGTVKRQL